MLLCSKCSVELVPNDNWSKGMINNRSKICRSCNSEKGKRWSKENRERAREAAKARRHADPAAMAARGRAYYAKNREKWSKYAENYRLANRTDPVRRAQQILTFTATRAKRKGIEFDLDKEFIAERLLAGICEATGLPIELKDHGKGNRRHDPFGPSLDRIDPTKGYTKDNVRLVVYMYNVAKLDFSDDEVLTLARAIVRKADQ